MEPKVITFCGQLASGKDTAADYMCDALNKQKNYGEWKRTAFAVNVKKVLMDTFDVGWDFVEKWKRKDEIPEGFDMAIRPALTFIGDGFRKIRNTIWIDLVFRNNSDNLIISDGRYLNEVEAVNENGGHTILVWRPGHENKIQNASEQQLMPYVEKLKKMKPMPSGLLDIDSPFDYFLVNDGTLEDFYKKIEEEMIPYFEGIWNEKHTK